MKAAYFYGAGKVKVEEVPRPTPGPKEAIVEVAYCGVCGSDRFKFYSGWTFPLLPGTKPEEMGRLEYIPGHEVSGEIAEVGEEVAGFEVGDRVAAYCIGYCGECYYCKQGLTHACLEFDEQIMSDHWDGGYAEYVRAPERNLLKLPDDVSLKVGNLTLDTLGVPYEAFKRIDIQEDTTVAVYGCGPIGLAAIKILSIQGRGKVYAVDIADNKLELARQFGAVEVINAAREDPVPVLRDLTDGLGTDMAIDFAGRQETLEKTVETPRKFGLAYIVGEYPSLQLNMSDFLHRHLTLMGGVYFPYGEHAEVLDLLRAGQEDFARIVTHVYPLDQISEAIHFFFEDDASIRVLVQP